MYKKIKIGDKFLRDFIPFKTYSEMNQLTAPLQSLNIKYFSVKIHYLDGRFSELSNSPEYLRQCYSEGALNEAHGAKHLMPDGLFLDQININDLSYYKNHPTFLSRAKERMQKFSLSSSIFVVENYPDRYEAFLFKLSSSQENQITDFVLRHHAFLYRFIDYFKDRGKKLLETARGNSIQLPWILRPIDQEVKSSILLVDPEKIQQFLQETDYKRVPYSPTLHENNLTPRELDIVSLLIKGKSLIQICSQLDISEITGAYHMKNIKQKLGSRTLFDLGYKLGNRDIL